MQDEEFARLIELGRRNVEIIELIRRHCAHAVVTKPPFGGRGLLEAETGLPIDMRTVRCEFAATPAPAGMEMETIALSFWAANCQGCPHREVRDVPNLAMLGAERLAQQTRDRERQDRERVQRASLRSARSIERHGRVAGEPLATRSFVELLDGIDSEAPDDRRDQLVDQARAAPERCSPLAARVLLDCARTVGDESILEALDHLQRADRVQPAQLLEVALQILSERPSRAAADIVVRLRAGLTPGLLVPALPSLVWLAGRSSEPFASAPPRLGGIALAAELELPDLLDELRDGIASADPTRRGRWAYAAAELIAMHPEVAMVLAESLVAALSLSESLSPYSGSPGSGIEAGLQAAFEANPIEVSAIFDRLATTLNVEARQALFRSYDQVFRSRLNSDPPAPNAGRIAIDALFGRLSGDWGSELVEGAVDALDLVARYHPQLLIGRVDAVFGALLHSVAEPATTTSTLDLVHPPGPVAAMEQANREWARRSRISKLREVVGHLSALQPAETLAGVEAVLDNASLPDDEAASELRGHTIRLLGDLGRDPALVAQVLPRIVTFALSQDIVARTYAIEALGEVASVPHRQLPEDILALLPVWLADPYRGPHRAAVHALRSGLEVSEQSLSSVIAGMMTLANAYTSEDPHFLEVVLDQLWSLTRRLDPEWRSRLQRWCLQVSEHLSTRDLESFIRWRAAREDDPNNADLIADRLLQALSDEERARDANRREDPLMRLLRDLPQGVLRPRAQAIADASCVHLPDDVSTALEFVEVLQAAGCWRDAEDVAANALQSIADTVEDRRLRCSIAAVYAAARVERTLSEGARVLTLEALETWDESLALRDGLEAEQGPPWETFL